MTDQPTISLAQWCAYLPYGIDVFLDVDAPIRGKYLLQPNNFSTVTYSGMWKPLLRPMNKDNEVSINMLLRLHQGDDDNNFLFFYDGKLFSTPEDGSPYITYEYMPYRYMQMLLSNHYDIFGLIGQGLALPIE